MLSWVGLPICCAGWEFGYPESSSKSLCPSTRYFHAKPPTSEDETHVGTMDRRLAATARLSSPQAFMLRGRSLKAAATGCGRRVHGRICCICGAVSCD